MATTMTDMQKFMKWASERCCPHLVLADTSRQPDLFGARRQTCTTCGTVVLNIDGEYNPELDAAAVSS